MKIRRLTYCGVTLLQGCLTTQSGVDTPLVVIGSESIQLPAQVEAVPEEGLVEILAPKGSDEPRDERVRARHEGDRLDFLDVENSQIRSPAMKAEKRVKIGTEALGKKLTTFRFGDRGGSRTRWIPSRRDQRSAS